MAINGLLPSNHTCFLCCSPPEPHNHVPPKFKTAATTVQNLGSRDPATISNYPRVTRHGLARISQRTQEPRQTCEYELTESIADLNRVISKGSLSSSECRQVHGRLVKLGGYTSAGNKLIKAYSKNYESLDDARRLFEEIHNREASAYAALIGSYCKSQRWVDLFSVLQLMINDGFYPDKYLWPTIIKAVSAAGFARSGKMIHGYGLRRRGFCEDVFIGNALIRMYASFGEWSYAKAVFNSMAVRDMVSWTALVAAYLDSGDFQNGMQMFRLMQRNGLTADLIAWNTLISGLARNGEIEPALQFMEEMQEESGGVITPNARTWNCFISGCVQCECYESALDAFVEMLCNNNEYPNSVTIVSVISACSGLGDVMPGMAVHSCAIKLGLCEDIHVAGSLMNMYSKHGYCGRVKRIFSRMNLRNTTIWNEMIASHVNDGLLDAAMELFHSMKDSGIAADEITYNIALGAYAKQGKKNKAYSLLLEMSQVGLEPSIVTYNSLISGFQQSGLSREALYLFKYMLSPSVDTFPGLLTKKQLQTPNPVTVSAALAACADLDSPRPGRELHGYVLRKSMDTNIFVSSALVDMYAKHGHMGAAEEVFWRIDNKNTVSGNTLMTGYVLNKEPRAVFPFFNRMLEEGIEMDVVTIMILIQACGEIGALRLGRELHCYLVKDSTMHLSSHKISSALIDMYCKCNSIAEAERVFQSAKHKDVALWNSMISSFSSHRMTDEAIALFEQMQFSGIVPDKVTFVAVLSACANAGLYEEGWKYFQKMESSYGIAPSLEHYTCMVSVMGVVGLLDEALAFISRMPFKPDACIWATLLRACRVHSNPEIGERAARELFDLEPGNITNYILLANIYSSVGLHDSVRKLRDSMKGRELLKVKECSSIDVSGKVYDFPEMIDDSPSTLENVLNLWDEFMVQMKDGGHLPLNPVLGEVEEELDPFSCLHTEKLAICFGIISSKASQQPIRVSKNSRMCIDCHMSAKFITKITEREIFVKDVGSYHRMRDGVCSCNDRW